MKWSPAAVPAACAGADQSRSAGEHDEQWPAWYAEYMVSERAGEELPI
jgi:hypothetical protein